MPTIPPDERLAAAVTPSLLRTMNQRVLLDRLFADGAATRPQLARSCGLSLPTVSAALEDLERAGLVRTSPSLPQVVGRPAATYEANPSAGHVVGIDIGRAWIRLIVADLSGDTLASLDTPNTARGATGLVQLVATSVAQALNKAQLTSAAITHTVIGSPGVLDETRGRVLYAANLPGWHRPGLTDALAEQLGSALTIENDANLAALGEQAWGAATASKNFAYLHIGTGIGLGIVIDGHLYRGHSGAAGEVGYLPIGDSLSPSRPGQPMRGMMEESLAADGVVRYAVEAGMTGDLTAQAVFQAAQDGDPLAVRALDETAKRLAQLLASITALLDPEIIVIGGGVGQSLDLLAAGTRAALLHLAPMQPNLILGALGAAAVSRGAVVRGLSLARETTFVSQVA